jgi:hypothetical protein
MSITKIGSLLLFSSVLVAQTLGQFRIVDFSAKTNVVVTNVSGLTLTITPGSFTLTTGQGIYIYPPISYVTDESGTFGNHGNRGRGYFIINVVDSSHITLTSEMYSGATVGIGNGVAVGDNIVPLTTYTLRQGPRVWLDGPINKGTWSSVTAYKPLEMVQAPDTNYYEAIADNTNQQPPNTTYWKAINNTLVGAGSFTASVRDTSDKANSNNFAYTEAQTLVSTYWGGAHVYDYSNNGFNDGSFGGMSAWLWLATDNAAYYTDSQYLYTRAEDLAGGTTACNENPGAQLCGSRGNNYDIYNLRRDIFLPLGGLSVIYETLNNTQKQGLADRLLNDLDVTHNGVDIGDCVNDGFIGSGLGIMTVGNQLGTVAGGGLNGLTDLVPGSVILRIFPGTTANWQVVGRVKSKDSDTQLTFETGQGLSQIASVTSPFTTSVLNGGNYWWYTHPFGYLGQKTCGVIWTGKHHPSSPRMIPGQEAAYGSQYKNIVNNDDSPRQNKTITSLASNIQTALLLGDFDIRAVRLGEQAINYYMTQTLAQENKSRWVGFNGHGTQYGTDANDISATMIAWVLKNSLTVTPPGVLTGQYLSAIIGAYQYSVLLGTPLFVQPWTTGYPIGSGSLTSLRLSDWGPPMLMSGVLYPSDTMTPIMWDYLKNRRGDYGVINADGGWGSQYFISYGWPFYDPNATKTAPTSLPLQRGFITTDINECIASGLYCRPDTGEALAVSQTGWSNTDTQIMLRSGAALPNRDDDNYAEAGSFTIAQNNGANSTFLLGGTGLGAGGYGYAKTPSSGLYTGNDISIWNSSNFDLYTLSSYQFAQMDRWAGNTVTGVADNSYVYARTNYTPYVRQASSNYSPLSLVQKSFFLPSASATNVTSEIIHFKSGSGLPNYVVSYDNVQVGTANQLRHYWHLQDSDSASSPTRHPEWVNFNTAAKTATLTVPSQARLNVKTFSVAGSTNPTVALQADNYSPTSNWAIQNTSITAGSWAAGTYTLTLAAKPFQAVALPTDGSVSITIAGSTISPSALLGTWVVTGYNTTGPTVSFAMASDPGNWVSGGIVYYPSWCSYATTYNPSGTCAGNFYFPWASWTQGAAFPGTYRVESCASTDGLTCDNETDGEWITVFQPSTNTAITLPTITQPSCTGTGGNCTALEIQDSTYPKVSFISRKGVLLTGMSVTTTHTGTAQYVVTGLSAGSYNVSRNGTVIASATVTQQDTTLSFTSTSGTIAVVQTGAPTGFLAISPNSLNFTCTSGGVPSSNQNVSINETGSVMTNWNSTSIPAWLTLTPSSGTSATTSVASVTCPGIGTYNASIPISTTDAVSNSPQTLTVTLVQASVSSPTITTTTLPNGTQSISYNQTLSATGGVPPYVWDMSSGTMCNGLTLNSSGTITGTPTTIQTCSFTARVTDSQSLSATQPLSITITSSLPSITLNLTPSPINLTCLVNNISPPQLVTFTTSGGAIDNWTASSGDFVITAVPNSGTVAQNFNVTANCGGLFPGNYSYTLNVSSTTPGVVTTPVNIPVNVTVTYITAPFGIFVGGKGIKNR